MGGSAAVRARPRSISSCASGRRRSRSPTRCCSAGWSGSRAPIARAGAADRRSTSSTSSLTTLLVLRLRLRHRRRGARRGRRRSHGHRRRAGAGLARRRRSDPDTRAAVRPRPADAPVGGQPRHHDPHRGADRRLGLLRGAGRAPGDVALAAQCGAAQFCWSALLSRRPGHRGRATVRPRAQARATDAPSRARSALLVLGLRLRRRGDRPALSPGRG